MIATAQCFQVLALLGMTLEETTSAQLSNGQKLSLDQYSCHGGRARTQLPVQLLATLSYGRSGLRLSISVTQKLVLELYLLFWR